MILCDEQAEFGGSLLGDASSEIDGHKGHTWVQRAIAELARNARVTLLPRTTAFGYFPHNLIGLNERLSEHLAAPREGLARERLWQVRAGRVILATGSIERPLVFPGNDRPGIMLAGAAQTYLNRYGVRVGKRAVIVTSNDTAYAAALDLHAAGVSIAAIADVRPEPAGYWPKLAREAGIEVLPGSNVQGTRGDARIAGVTLTAGAFECDVLLMSGGFTPSDAPLLTIKRQACLERDAAGVCSGAVRGERTLGGRLPRHLRARRSARRWLCGRRACGIARRESHCAAGELPALSGRPARGGRAG